MASSKPRHDTLQIFFCGVMLIKNQEHSTVPTDLLDLKARIILAFEELRDNHNLIRRVMISMRKRAQCCIERNGRHIEKR